MIEDIDLEIPAGTKSNSVIVYKGYGEKTNNQIGDLHLTVTEIPHKDFERKDYDLIVKKTISLNESLCGTEFDVQMFDKSVKVDCKDEILNPETEKRIKNQGMPIPNDRKRGDLVIKFEIVFPKLKESSLERLEAILDNDEVKMKKYQEEDDKNWSKAFGNVITYPFQKMMSGAKDFYNWITLKSKL